MAAYWGRVMPTVCVWILGIIAITAEQQCCPSGTEDSCPGFDGSTATVTFSSGNNCASQPGTIFTSCLGSPGRVLNIDDTAYGRCTVDNSESDVFVLVYYESPTACECRIETVMTANLCTKLELDFYDVHVNGVTVRDFEIFIERKDTIGDDSTIIVRCNARGITSGDLSNTSATIQCSGTTAAPPATTQSTTTTTDLVTTLAPITPVTTFIPTSGSAIPVETATFYLTLAFIANVILYVALL